MKPFKFSALVLISTVFSFIAIFNNTKASQACNPFDANCPDLIPDPFTKDKPLGESSTTQEEKEVEAVIFDLEVSSNENKPPSLYNATEFDDWLISAHRVIHDWYFSLIDGSLRNQFEGK